MLLLQFHFSCFNIEHLNLRCIDFLLQFTSGMKVLQTIDMIEGKPLKSIIVILFLVWKYLESDCFSSLYFLF